LFLLLSWKQLSVSTQDSIRTTLVGADTLLWNLFRTCSRKFRVSDVLCSVECLFKLPSVGNGQRKDEGEEDDDESVARWMNSKEDVLAALAPVARDLIAQSPSLKQSLFQALVEELALAASRMYAAIPWDDSDIAQPLVVHSIWSLTTEDSSHPLNEIKVSQHPSVRFACWATEVLKSSISVEENRHLIHAWSLALRSPGTRMKIVASRMLLSFVQDDDDDDELFTTYIGEVVESKRIKDVAARLLSRSGTVSLQAVPSKYALAMSELSSVSAVYDD